MNKNLYNMQEEDNNKIIRMFTIASSFFAGFLIALFMVAWLMTK